jgi:hypothetical protein
MFSWKKEYSVSKPDGAIQYCAQREDNGLLDRCWGHIVSDRSADSPVRSETVRFPAREATVGSETLRLDSVNYPPGTRNQAGPRRNC